MRETGKALTEAHDYARKATKVQGRKAVRKQLQAQARKAELEAQQ
jgi:hypothetical protein